MSLITVCEIIFFIGFGVSFFRPNRTLSIVVAVVAIIIGVLMLLASVGGVRLG
jgi:hypothetical protein